MQNLPPNNWKHQLEKLPVWIWLTLVLLLVSISLYPTLLNGWVNWDDDTYVLGNRMIQKLSLKNLKSIFSSPEYLGLYHPLTLLSYAIDYAIWGKNAFGYHLSNLLLHLLNVVLVFAVFRKLPPESTWLALFVALLFGLHPMHVESVAWISTRKDVLYSAFFLLSLLAYMRFRALDARQDRPHWAALTWALLFFLAALLSKGIAFILPLILLLIDYLQERKWSWSEQLKEKSGFFLLMVAAIWLAKFGQQSSDSMQGVLEYSWVETFFISTRNICVYLLKAIVPVKLGGFHPFPFLEGVELPLYYYLTFIPVLLGIGGLAFAFYRNRKLFFGFAFFLIAIAPLSQFIPFGKAVIAERYTYLAYLGLFYLLGLGVHYIWHNTTPIWTKLRKPMVALLLIWLSALGYSSWHEAQNWENGEVFWSAVIKNYPTHYYAYLSRAKYYLQQNRQEEAIEDIQKTIEYNPGLWEGWYLKGIALEKADAIDSARQAYTIAIAKGGAVHQAYHNRGIIQIRSRQHIEEAYADFDSAISIKPDYALAWFNRGLCAKILGQNEEALKDYHQAISLEPWNAVFYRNRAILYYSMEKPERALSDLSQAISLNPQSSDFWFMRSEVNKALGRFEAARKDANKARELGLEVSDEYLKSLQP